MPSLVASRDILTSCQFHSPNPVSSVSHTGYSLVHSFTQTPITLYVCSSAIPDFVHRMLPSIHQSFRLVSGDSDTTIPADCWGDAQVLLTHPRLIGWWSQNCIPTHPRLHQIPIGLDYHTLANAGENHPWGERKSPTDQEVELLTIRGSAKPLSQRRIKCYGNFQFLTNTRYGYDRQDAIANIPTDYIDYEPKHTTRSDTWKKMIEYAFIPSPHGNGLDCHRTWEALALGCIPIVKTSPLDPLFEDLPIWIVGKWSDITEETLATTRHRIMSTSYSMKKLTLSHWINTIQNGN